MRDVRFDMLRNRADIAKAFGLSEDVLNGLLLDDISSCYEAILLPKRSRKSPQEYRKVYKTLDFNLFLFQKNIATAISNKVDFPNYVQGFVKRRSIASNASIHLGNDLLLTADIKGFFESISFFQVVKVLKELGCNTNVSEDIARLITLNETLTQGSPSSPIISNLVCKEMDVELNYLARQVGAEYSRYADDITISGKQVPEKEDISSVFNKFGFKMNQSKFFLSKRGQSQYVTGLSIFDDKYPRIPKKMKKRLRQELYFIKKFGLANHFERKNVGVRIIGQYGLQRECARITGWIDYITSIEPKVGNIMKNEWIEILGSNARLHYFRRNRRGRINYLIAKIIIDDIQND